MIDFRCKCCGGDLDINRSGELICKYCGTKTFFSDKQLQEARSFRQQLLSYLSASASQTSPEPQLWQYADTVTFQDTEGNDIHIEYIYHCVEDSITMYSARKNVLYIFPPEKKELAQMAVGAFRSVTFPSADTKQLQRCFPTLAGEYTLSDGSVMLAYQKNENLYPLGLFGTLPAVHVEWIISRMENIACVLAYNDLVHNGIGYHSVFINPKTHEAALFGGWQGAKTCQNGSQKDLIALRETARKLLGDGYGDGPKPLIDFLTGTPRDNAFEDFALWDHVIETQLGGRRFTEMKL